MDHFENIVKNAWEPQQLGSRQYQLQNKIRKCRGGNPKVAEKSWDPFSSADKEDQGRNGSHAGARRK